MYRYVAVLSFFIVALILPAAASAAVVINEVAWMGTSASANAEWMELYNSDTSSVTLAGWKLVASTGSPSITLTGIIEGGGYYLLERTSDASVPEAPADQIYSGALANTGATLTLLNEKGEVQDKVEGGTDWKSIGGNNDNKQTAQRIGSGWVTSVGTPRALNTETAVVASTTTSTPGEPTESVGGTAIVITRSTTTALPTLRIEAGVSRIVTTNAEVPFRAVVYDTSGSQHRDAKVTWSFGDGAQAQGRETTHAFVLPGTYLVIIHAVSGGGEVSTALQVRVEDSFVQILTVDEKGITLKNTGKHIADLSRWKLVAESTQFEFPPFTALLPGFPVTFPPSVTGIASTSRDVQLLFPGGVLASLPTLVVEVVPVVTEATVPLVVAPQVPLEKPSTPIIGIPRVGEREQLSEPVPTIVYEEATTAPSTPATTGVLGASVGKAASLFKSPWTLSFFGLVVAASAVLVIL